MFRLFVFLLVFGGFSFGTLYNWPVIEGTLFKFNQRVFEQNRKESNIRLAIPNISIKAINGEAFLERYGVKTPLSKEDDLKQNDSLLVGENSSVMICYGNSSCSKIGSNSIIVIKELISSVEGYRRDHEVYKFEFIKGEMTSNHHGLEIGQRGEDLIIIYESVSVKILGTKFYLSTSSETGNFNVAVSEGNVTFVTPDKRKVAVNENQGVIIDKNGIITSPGVHPFMSDIDWKKELAGLEIDQNARVVDLKNREMQSDPLANGSDGWIHLLSQKMRELRKELKINEFSLSKLTEVQTQMRDATVIHKVPNAKSIKENITKAGGPELSLDTDQIKKDMEKQAKALEEIDKEDK